MSNETLFHSIFCLLFAALITLRLTWHWKAGTWKDKEAARAGFAREGSFARVRWVVGPPWGLVLLLYLFKPSTLAWAALPLWPEVRWLGVGLMVCALILLVWVHQALGSNFNTTLVIRRDHELITRGPYRWVRHPMYSCFVLLFAGAFLASANLLIGFIGGVFLFALLYLRTPREEEQLREKFGSEYVRYRARTGLIFPRLGK
jgi:protein-S-isoprenylcysteine O-methyltransferase Ste14